MTTSSTAQPLLTSEPLQPFRLTNQIIRLIRRRHPRIQHRANSRISRLTFTHIKQTPYPLHLKIIRQPAVLQHLPRHTRRTPELPAPIRQTYPPRSINHQQKTTTSTTVANPSDAERRVCPPCGRAKYADDFELDHKHPKSKGGPDTDENLWLICGACNSKKGANSVQYLLDKLATEAATLPVIA